jgi:hypothetical protein
MGTTEMAVQEKALAHEQCCHETAARAKALADKQGCHKAAAQEKALANKQHCHEASTWAKALADKQHCHRAAAQEKALANEQRCHKAATWAKASIYEDDKQCCHETAMQEKALANNANEQHCNKIAAREKALADDTNKQHCWESAERAAALAESALAAEHHHWESVECTAALAEPALATEQAAVLADLALPELALAKDKRRQKEAVAKQRGADDKRIMALHMPPNPIDVAIRRIQAECALCTAPLDAILAKIARNNIAHDASAPPTTTLPHPSAMLYTPPPPHPMTYVGAVLSTTGGSTHATFPLLWHHWLYHRLLLTANSGR